MPSVEVVRDALLGDASNQLAVAHQELADRSARGKPVQVTTQEVSAALERVEALQEGVTYKEPRHQPEALIAEEAAKIVTMALDGAGAIEKHLRDILNVMEEIHKRLPEEEAKRFVIFRQGAPYKQTGMTEWTPTTRFDSARTVKARSHIEAMEKIIKRGDEEGDPYGETPPVVDGEVIVAAEMNNRKINGGAVWVEKVQRPVFQGEAPRNNSDDPRFN